MMGKHAGLVALIRQKVPSLFSIHSVIHRENLIGKIAGEELHDALLLMSRAINHIKKRP